MSTKDTAKKKSQKGRTKKIPIPTISYVYTKPASEKENCSALDEAFDILFSEMVKKHN
jgi:hypothetical protein